MVGETDRKEKDESRKIAALLISLVVLLVVGALLLLPGLSEFAATHFEPGLGLRTAAVVSFFVSAVLMIIFAIASGDGLLGEVQFIIPGFLLFFVIFWLMMAWIF